MILTGHVSADQSLYTKDKELVWANPKFKSVILGQVLKKHNNADHRAQLCTAIDQLSDVLRSEEVESLKEEFYQAHSDTPNFMLWSTYISIVEICWTSSELRWMATGF